MANLTSSLGDYNVGVAGTSTDSGPNDGTET